LFVLSNIFLIIVPFVPPVPGTRVYERMPYWVSAGHFTSTCQTDFGAMDEFPSSYTLPSLGACRLLECRTGWCGAFGCLGEMGTGWNDGGWCKTTGCLATCSRRFHRYDVLLSEACEMLRRSFARSVSSQYS
jgi:hypothetical protein